MILNFFSSLKQKHYSIPSSSSLQDVGLPTEFKLFPQYLKPYGFKSHLVGK